MKGIAIRERSYINATAAVIMSDNRAFFSDRINRALYEVNLDNKTPSICGVFSQSGSHILAAQIGTKLLWFPESNRSDTIDVYDTEKREFSTLKIPPETQLEENRRFSKILQNEDYLYVLPCVSTSWLQIDRKTEQVQCHAMPNNIKETIILGAATDGKDIYMCGRSPLSIYKMNMKGEWSVLYYDPKIDYIFEDLFIIDDTLYVVPRVASNPWIKMHKEGGNIEIVDFGIINNAEYYAAGQMGPDIIRLPYYGNVGYRYSVSNNDYEEFSLIDYVDRANYYYWSSCECSKGILFFPSDGDAPLLLVDKNGISTELSVSKENRDLQVLFSMMGVNINV